MLGQQKKLEDHLNAMLRDKLDKLSSAARDPQLTRSFSEFSALLRECSKTLADMERIEDEIKHVQYCGGALSTIRIARAQSIRGRFAQPPPLTCAQQNTVIELQRLIPYLHKLAV